MFKYQKPAKAQVIFQVKDMTSAFAASAVLNAVRTLDVGATVNVDVPMRRVEIDSQTAEPSALRDAISRAGYSTVRQWPSDRAYLWA